MIYRHEISNEKFADKLTEQINFDQVELEHEKEILNWLFWSHDRKMDSKSLRCNSDATFAGLI